MIYIFLPNQDGIIIFICSSIKLGLHRIQEVRYCLNPIYVGVEQVLIRNKNKLLRLINAK